MLFDLDFQEGVTLPTNYSQRCSPEKSMFLFASALALAMAHRLVQAVTGLLRVLDLMNCVVNCPFDKSAIGRFQSVPDLHTPRRLQFGEVNA